MKRRFLAVLSSAFLLFGLASCDTETLIDDNNSKKEEKQEEKKEEQQGSDNQNIEGQGGDQGQHNGEAQGENQGQQNGENQVVDQGQQDGEAQGDGQSQQGSENQGETQQGNQEQGEQNDQTYDATPTIFLAGDSTVKTYIDGQYIAGWGQYLGLYMPESISVHNAAQGGRSSRSFINEGRLYDTKETGFSFTFSENGGKSIESEIKAGDFLFIQFGHNDDDTKKYDDLTYQYERFVPLGEADSNGIYPTTKPTKVSTSNLPSDMPSATKTNVAKYGANYYAYDETGASGTYKGYLKEYIDFARTKGATPVLVTPVARVKFNGSTIKSGPGLHGDNFAYVEAMKQLASEEDCLLIDLFSYTKTMLEVATINYANYVMALKPNGLTGAWPTGYDLAYGNTKLGFEGYEATHYNKYGAYLEAAYIAQTIKESTETHNDGKEFFSFRDNVLTTPSQYIAPSNLLTKAKIQELEATITGVTVTDPNRTFPSVAPLEAKLAEIPLIDDITVDNYLAVNTLAEEALALYTALNVDDRNIEYKKVIDDTLAKVQEIIISLRPVATSTTIFKADDLNLAVDATVTSKVTSNGFDIVGASGKAITIKTGTTFTYNDTEYTTSKSLSMGGAATFGTSRYVEFTITKKASITIVAKSTGSDNRIVKMVNSSNIDTNVTFAANGSLSITTNEDIEAGTYRIGSAGSGIYIYAIIIEYFN